MMNTLDYLQWMHIKKKRSIHWRNIVEKRWNSGLTPVRLRERKKNEYITKWNDRDCINVYYRCYGREERLESVIAVIMKAKDGI